MNKRLIAVPLILLLCVLALTGCSSVRVFERDIQVVLEVNGELTGSETVNIFNNAVVTEPTAPDNKIFKGWTTQESWEDAEADEVPVIPNKGLVRYKDIESAIRGEAQSVILRAVFVPAPRRDLVIAWYAKEGTSGLNQGHIDAFQAKLYEYLTSQGYQPETMDILLRPYEGGVADTCAAIAKDGDVDLMLGWSSSSNLTGTGGWTEGADFVQNVGGITVGEKARYIARISDTELCLKVYAWMQEAYGEGASAPAADSTVPTATEAPAPAEAPVPEASDNKLVIGWYAKTETSGLDAAMMDKLSAALPETMTQLGYPADAVEIVLRPYEGNVDAVQQAVLQDGDVDIMVGMKKFALEGIDMEVQEDVAMGEKTDRRIHRISNDTLAKAVFEWLKTDEARTSFRPENEPAAEVSAPHTEEASMPAENTVQEIKHRLVIGWYAKTETSGLDAAMMDKLGAALPETLTALGYPADTVEIVLRPYEGNVDTVQQAVLQDGDVNIMVGMKKFALEGIDMEVQEDVAMGDKTDRRIHLVSDDAMAKAVFEWLRTDEARTPFKPE